MLYNNKSSIWMINEQINAWVEFILSNIYIERESWDFKNIFKLLMNQKFIIAYYCKFD